MGEVNMKSRIRTRTYGSVRGRGPLGGGSSYSIKMEKDDGQIKAENYLS